MSEVPVHVIDYEGLVWRVVRDGGMATRADFTGITSIGIDTLRQTRGPLLFFDALAYRAEAASPAALDVPEDRFALILHEWEHGTSTPMDRCRHGHILDARYLAARLTEQEER